MITSAIVRSFSATYILCAEMILLTMQEIQKYFHT